MSWPALSRVCILGAALLFSTGGAAIKLCTMTGWQVASLRSGVAALVLAAVLPASRQRWSRRTLVVGLSYAATMILFVLSNKATTAANTIFLQSTAPLYVLLLAPLLLKEPLRLRDLLLMAVLAAGLTLFFVEVEPAVETAPQPLRGNVLAAAAGLSWGVTLVGLRWLERRQAPAPAASVGRQSDSPGLAAVVAGNVITFFVALPFALSAPKVAALAQAGVQDWLVIAYLGVVQIGLAYILLTRGFRHVPVLEASLLILLEPTLNPIWAWLVHGETPGRWAVVGGATIVLATAGKTWMERAAQPPRTATR